METAKIFKNLRVDGPILQGPTSTCVALGQVHLRMGRCQKSEGAGSSHSKGQVHLRMGRYQKIRSCRNVGLTG